MDPQEYIHQATLIHNEKVVNKAIIRLAKQLNYDYLNELPVVLCVMSGGTFFTGQLLPKLSFALEFDYIHATRYHGVEGSQVTWLVRPKKNVIGRKVLILDDILDEGLTLKSIVDECIKLGATDVKVAVLVEKQLNKNKPVQADYTGLEVPNRYVFGCGMDVHGWWRNLPAIHAL